MYRSRGEQIWKAWTGHAAAVTCALCRDGVLVTGSRDHSVRVAGRPGAGRDVTRRALEPPHYDGVTAVCAPRDGPARLYTASRDMALRRWDLDACVLLEVTRPNARRTGAAAT